MAFGVNYRKLEPHAEHVWELKTIDVRLFGWLATKGTIILVCGTLKENVKNYKLYAPFIQEVIAFRDALDLNPPKVITGVRYHEIL
jgi:hypothetical protein